MLLFIKQAISEAFTLFSVYFLLMYSLGITALVLFDVFENFNPIFLFLFLFTALVLYLRKIFQKRYRKIYQRFALDSGSSLFTRIILSFAFSFHFFAIFIPEFRQDYLGIRGFEADMAIYLAQYLLAAVVGVIFVAIILLILKRGISWDEKKSTKGLGVVLTIVGMLIISATGTRLSVPYGSWYGISESYLAKVGYLAFGSIPIFQFRLLFFGGDLKKKKKRQ